MINTDSRGKRLGDSLNKAVACCFVEDAPGLNMLREFSRERLASLGSAEFERRTDADSAGLVTAKRPMYSSNEALARRAPVHRAYSWIGFDAEFCRRLGARESGSGTDLASIKTPAAFQSKEAGRGRPRK